MKILQLGKFYPIKGGVEKVMYDLMIGLSAHDIECDMLCATNEKNKKVKRINPYANLMFSHACVQVAGTMIAPSMISQLRKRKNDYDIIHIHHPDPMACMALYFSGYKGKVILHWHSDIVRQKKLMTLYRPFQKWLIKRADLIVGTTPTYIKESDDLRNVQHKTTYLPIGVDRMLTDTEGAERLKTIYHNRKIIFSLGRLVHYKGYENLVKAAQYLPDDYVIVIGGAGPLLEELRNLAKQLNVREKVILIGFVREHEVPAYYTACELFCLPSVQKTEAFGIVQIEAMSCGKPVIATKIPGSGVAWVNEHGVSGLNVTPQKPEEIATAIRAIVEDKEMYKKLSEGASNRYKTHFTEERMIEKAIGIYKRLMESPTLNTKL